MKKTLTILSALSLLAGSIVLASKVKANEDQGIQTNGSVNLELTSDDSHGKSQEELHESDEAEVHEHEDENEGSSTPTPIGTPTSSPIVTGTPTATPIETATATPTGSATPTPTPTQSPLVLGVNTSLNLQDLINQLIDLLKKLVEK